MGLPYILTLEDVGTMFNVPFYSMEGVASGANQLVDDPFNSGRGTVLKSDFYKDQWGHGQSDIVLDPVPMGIQVDVRWDGPPSYTDFTEIYFAMDMAFPLDFIFPWSIHTWSMKNGYLVPYDDLPRNIVGDYRLFTANMGQINAVLDARVPDTGGDHSLGNYYYNAEKIQRTKYWTDQPTLAPENADAEAMYAQHVRGKWMRMESHYKLNTTYAPYNGIMESWVNGVKVLEITDFPWRTSDFSGYNFDWSIFGNWVGGNSQDFAVVQDQSMYYDNLIVSTERITG